MKLIVGCALAGALAVLAACGGGSKNANPTPKPAASATPRPCAGQAALATVPAGSPQVLAPEPGGKKMFTSPPPMTIDQNKRYFATIKMDIGDIRLELYPKDAPQHVNNFIFLARQGFYDGVTFHRVLAGFVAQAGDPTGTGSGGPGYTISDEVNACRFLDGTLGMAKTDAPNSAGSQWFIDFAPQPKLDGQYTAFGQLVAGRDVLDKIAPRDPATATQPGTKINTIVIEEQ